MQRNRTQSILLERPVGGEPEAALVGMLLHPEIALLCAQWQRRRRRHLCNSYTALALMPSLYRRISVHLAS